MRRHLSQQDELHHRAASDKRTAIEQLKDAESAEHRHTLMRQIVKAHSIKRAAEAHDGSWECTICKATSPKGKHVAVQVAGVLAHRGQAERAPDDPEGAESPVVDLPPLVKDYPATLRPYLYICHDCAIAAGIVTADELETGRRKDDINE
jgi:hypothetical protein